MFSRRRGSSKTRAPVDTSTSNAATTAGQLAFLQQSGSTPALSSAAAAAALRSYTSTPEPVGSLQTKRIIRKGSVSSQTSGSGVVANGRPGLKRTNSSGSMTERTFRSPSPGQWNASSPPSNDIPPVPALPQTINRPSSSMDAPQRIMSPTPAQGKRSSSLDGGATAPGGTQRANKRLSNVNEIDELERAHSNFAKNFSRRDVSPLPGSAQLSGQDGQSAPGASTNYYTQGTDPWYTQDAGGRARAPTRPNPPEPSTRTSSMSSLTLPPVQPLRGTQPVSAAGRHYGQQRAYGTNQVQQTKVYDPNSRTFVSQPVSQQQQQSTQPALQAARRVKSTETVYDKNSRTFVPKYPQAYQQADSTASSPRSIASEPPRSVMPRKQRSFPAGSTSPEPTLRTPNRFSSFAIVPSATARSAATVQKQPAVVRENTEAETRATGRSYPPTEPTDGTRAAQPTVLPTKTFAAPTENHQRSTSLDVPRDGAARGRNVSQSPQRSARFSPSPVLEPERHAPPPRDLSPAKSAMKQSPSMRPISPMAPSETSEAPSLDAIPGKKKKSVRVSFDEHAQELGAPTTALASSVRPRSPEVVEDIDDDGMMKPRPALPSFGSVRRDRAQPSTGEKVTEMSPDSHEVSSDRALGGVLRNSLEPLPPEVTSKETAGYVSDESSEADVPAISAGVAQSAKMEDQKVPLTQAGEPVVAPDRANGNAVKVPADGADVPDIALMPPTPLLGDDAEKRSLNAVDNADQADEAIKRNSMEVFSVPGGWTDDAEKAATPAVPATEVAKSTPEPAIAARRASAEDSAATMTVTPIYVVKPPEPLSDIDETSDDSAAFSDAFEDPSDFEDEGGFRSLDAIVESPLPSPKETRTIPVDREVPESPTLNRPAKTPEIFDGSEPAAAPVVAPAVIAATSDEPSSPTTTTGDWSQATTYWSQLSKERRAQIEREALSSDDEVRAPPVVSKKLKKKTAVAVTDDSAALPTLRKTMRASSGPTSAEPSVDDGVHMRSSMRTGGTLKPAFRETSPSQRPQSSYTEPRSVFQKTAARPTSAGGPLTSSAGAGKSIRPSPITRFSDDSVYSQDTPVKRSPPRAKPEPPKVSARLQKELAKGDESDSESSFKKRRKAASSVNGQGRYSMRKSMRGGVVDTAPAVETIPRPDSPSSERAGRFGLRSLSPTFGRNKAGSTRDSSQDSGLRTSLRGAPSKGGKPTSQVGGMKTSLRGATTNQAPTKQKQTTSMKSKLQSRFADSDDEDEAPRRTFFKSRFADSDDESEPGSPPPMPRPRTDLTPVRGIPRRRGQEDGDSTDLEEEDDNPAERASKRFTGLIGPHPASTAIGDASSPAQAHDKEGEALQRGSLRQKAGPDSPQTTTKPSDINFAPPDKKKKGFMNSILRRNRQSSSSIPQVNSTSPARIPTSPVVAPQTPTQERPTSPLRTGTTSSMLSKQGTPSTPSGPPTGKLVRKESYQKWQQNANSSDIPEVPASPGHPTVTQFQERDLNEILLPLPDSASSPSSPNVGARPATSDGFAPDSATKMARTMRPELAQRSQSGSFVRRVQIQAGEEGSEPGEREPTGGSKAVYSQKTGKKKKFGMLRRAFGLND